MAMSAVDHGAAHLPSHLGNVDLYALGERPCVEDDIDSPSIEEAVLAPPRWCLDGEVLAIVPVKVSHALEPTPKLPVRFRRDDPDAPHPHRGGVLERDLRGEVPAAEEDPDLARVRQPP